MSNKRNRTPSEYTGYGLYLYFLGLSLRNVIKALSYLYIVKRSHVSIWKWIQKFRPKKTLTRKKKVFEYIVDVVYGSWTRNLSLFMGALLTEKQSILAQEI
ncbi:MAG: hypothetical protein P0116_16100 [Candidatus Nitrosocosmicus sp.]|nr:hypothetical protein [Candidatus Nitrosocosmicus sp.]